MVYHHIYRLVLRPLMVSLNQKSLDTNLSSAAVLGWILCVCSKKKMHQPATSMNMGAEHTQGQLTFLFLSLSFHLSEILQSPTRCLDLWAISP